MDTIMVIGLIILIILIIFTAVVRIYPCDKYQKKTKEGFYDENIIKEYLGRQKMKKDISDSQNKQNIIIDGLKSDVYTILKKMETAY